MFANPPRLVIRFKLPWRGRQPGQLNDQLEPGVMQALVQTGRAEWAEAKPTATSEPAETSESKSVRRKRHSSPASSP